MHKRKAVVISAGIAGIAAAIRLSVQGFSVDVYEKNGVPGGKISAFTIEGFHFDGGPSLFIQPENIEELFEWAGEPIEPYFSYRRVPIACKYFYENGKEIIAYTDADKFAEEAEQKTDEPAQHIKTYLSEAKKLYNRTGRIFLDHSLHTKRTWFSRDIFKALGGLKFSYLFRTMSSYNRLFKTPELNRIFNRFATYNGSSPYKAPAMLSLIAHPEHNCGVFYPVGGMISISNALYALALKQGVHFHFNSPVQKIICPENRATGIVIAGKNIPADIIINNGDIYYTYKQLVGRTPKTKRIFSRERSSSALVFYWGIKGNFPQLELHNTFFTENYPEEFDHIFQKKKLYHDPTVYINITSKEEADKAPRGCENWFVMINTAANTGYDPDELISAAKKNIISKMNRIMQADIEPLIITEKVLHPQLIQDATHTYDGSLYGTSSNSKMAAFSRHPNFTSYIKNLYFCGGTVHPGGGIPLCLKSAMIVAEMVKNDFPDKNLRMLKSKYQKATAAAIVFHAIGLAGILFFDRDFFTAATPCLMLLMTVLIFYTQENINIPFVVFFVVCFAVGFGVELLGTSTGLLFGNYSYGSSLGPAIKNTPLVTGINWFIIIYCCGVTINILLERLSRKLEEMTGNPSPAVRFLSLVTDAAMLSIFFDWIMEPAAIKLGYWTWTGSGEPPLYNYACWLVVSALLLLVFSFLKFDRRNIFAVNLLLIMMMFFMLIRTFL